MSDKKISALSSASLPLAGTEVLPIVQSSATVKVATDNLTVKNIRSNATSGILQIAGPAAAATRVMTTPDANFSAARIDASQSFTGDQTLSTGNLIQGTAAKGFNFTANTAAAGKTSQLFNYYEEGAWTPAITYGDSTGTVTFSDATYTRIGRAVLLFFTMTPDTTFAVNSGTGTPRVTALPFAPAVFSAGNFVINSAGVSQTYFLTAAIHPSSWVLLPQFNATSDIMYFTGVYYV